MRFGRSIESKYGVDELDYETPGPTPEIEAEEQPQRRLQVNPAGIGLAVVGGALLCVAPFLPLDEPENAFARIQDNTLIQHGGWDLILFGAVIVLAAASPRRYPIAVAILSLIAAAIDVRYGLDKSLRTLYSIGPNGQPQGSGTVVPLAIAVYIAGAGALLSFIGGWVMFSSRKWRAVEPPEATQRCPDCAESVLAAARVCKHCGGILGSA